MACIVGGVDDVPHARRVKLPRVFIKVHLVATVDVVHGVVHVNDARDDDGNDDEAGNVLGQESQFC